MKNIEPHFRPTRSIVHDAEGFRLEVIVSRHPVTGATVEFFSTWPKANHPEPHRLLSLTLPADSFQRLADEISKASSIEPGGN